MTVPTGLFEIATAAHMEALGSEVGGGRAGRAGRGGSPAPRPAICSC